MLAYVLSVMSCLRARPARVDQCTTTRAPTAHSHSPPCMHVLTASTAGFTFLLVLRRLDMEWELSECLPEGHHEVDTRFYALVAGHRIVIDNITWAHAAAATDSELPRRQGVLRCVGLAPRVWRSRTHTQLCSPPTPCVVVCVCCKNMHSWCVCCSSH